MGTIFFFFTLKKTDVQISLNESPFMFLPFSSHAFLLGTHVVSWWRESFPASSLIIPVLSSTTPLPTPVPLSVKTMKEIIRWSNASIRPLLNWTAQDEGLFWVFLHLWSIPFIPFISASVFPLSWTVIVTSLPSEFVPSPAIVFIITVSHLFQIEVTNGCFISFEW